MTGLFIWNISVIIPCRKGRSVMRKSLIWPCLLTAPVNTCSYIAIRISGGSLKSDDSWLLHEGAHLMARGENCHNGLSVLDILTLRCKTCSVLAWWGGGVTALLLSSYEGSEFWRLSPVHAEKLCLALCGTVQGRICIFQIDPSATFHIQCQILVDEFAVGRSFDHM